MNKLGLYVTVLLLSTFLTINVNAEPLNNGTDTREEEINRKVAEFSEQRKALEEFQKKAQEHAKILQEKYSAFQEKLKNATTAEEKYRLQLEFKAEQEEFQNSIKNSTGQIAVDPKNVELKKEDINRKVAEYASQRKLMADFQIMAQEHTLVIQEEYKIFQEKLLNAQTPEEKYRLQLEFKADQDEAKQLFQDKVRKFQQEQLQGNTR